MKELETKRLILKKPTIDEQYQLWDIVRKENVNKYYFPTPDRIFNKFNLKKDNISDLKKARKIFLEQLNNWELQQPFYQEKIKNINLGDNKVRFTWSIFLKNNEVIGQITVQPKNEYPNNPKIRDVGWFINPKHQNNGYATEAAESVLKYMFEEIEIEKIITSAAIINSSSWKIMEKLGFIRTGEKQTTYFDENNNILKSYCYECTKESFEKRYKFI
jgi:RimJ/RimL family protein N-acetyltransferase